jgi:tetratricopeptide (TPR) repeat protein
MGLIDLLAAAMIASHGLCRQGAGMKVLSNRVGVHSTRKYSHFPLQLLLTVVMLATANIAVAHEDDKSEQQVTRVLGEISFPTSAGSPQAQQAFIRGMLLLHLFEYPFAREEFLQAQEIEPGFALAYWGEAMTYNHPMWDVQDLEAGRAALVKLAKSRQERLRLAPTPKEKALMASLEELYGAGSKSRRDQAYSRAMEWMAARFPDDHEIQLFYALSLFGVQAGVRDIPTYMLSTAIAQTVFSVNPKHPGAAHYLIHGVDDPDHAVLGLAAARALAEMAPDAGHSLHMTSHIFTALGMWHDVVVANENAARVSNAMRQEQEQEARYWGHYNFWLLYGYLQQGRVEQAKVLLMAAIKQAQSDDTPPADPMELDPDRSLQASVVQMWTRYLVETGDWNGEISKQKFKLGEAFDPNLNFLFVQSMRAAHSGEAEQATTFLKQFRYYQTKLESALSALPEVSPTDLLYLRRLDVMELEIMAAVEDVSGELDSAIVHAMEASRLEGQMPFAFGPPFVDLPSAEFLAGLLEKSEQYPVAASAFNTQLKRARLRTASLEGLARCLQQTGGDAEASYAVEKLKIIWRGADADIKAKLATFK